MITLDKKYYPYKELIHSFANYVIHYQQLTIFEQSELVIALNDLNISVDFYRNLFNNILNYNPDIALNQDVLNQLNRYWALSICGVNEEERRAFVKHWLNKDNRRMFGDDFIMISWILIIIVDNKDQEIKEQKRIKAKHAFQLFPSHQKFNGMSENPRKIKF